MYFLLDTFILDLYSGSLFLTKLQAKKFSNCVLVFGFNKKDKQGFKVLLKSLFLPSFYFSRIFNSKSSQSPSRPQSVSLGPSRGANNSSTNRLSVTDVSQPTSPTYTDSRCENYSGKVC